jgi:hypothetical protein
MKLAAMLTAREACGIYRLSESDLRVHSHRGDIATLTDPHGTPTYRAADVQRVALKLHEQRANRSIRQRTSLGQQPPLGADHAAPR